MARDSAQFATVEEAAEEFRQGKMIVLVDDEDRENEGDLAIAAEKVSPEAINFMAKFGRGLVCIALTEQRCDELPRYRSFGFSSSGFSTESRSTGTKNIFSSCSELRPASVNF